MKHDNFEEHFDWLLAFMAVLDPFTHELLTLLRRVESTNTPTMGVLVDGTHMELRYNRKFVESLTDEEIRYVLDHEMFHLALHHCTGRLPEDKMLQRRHNIAADLAVNSINPENKFKKMPDGILLPKLFDLPEKLSLEQYFDLLPKVTEGSKGKNNNQGKSGDSENGTGDSEDESNGDDRKEGHGGFDDHNGWSTEEDSVADEIIRQKIREMENSDRYWGNMPSDVKETILAAQKSKVAWHRLLRAALGTIISKDIVHTFKRPNRRFGYPYTGFKRECVDRVLLLWDTSGSVFGPEQSRFLSETNRVAEVQPVDVLMFDTDIKGEPIPFNRKMQSIQVVGSGGTSFKEPFEYADKMHYGSVICLTDGAAASIPKPKYVHHIIWAIVGGGKPPVDWGRVVNIDTVNGRHAPSD